MKAATMAFPCLLIMIVTMAQLVMGLSRIKVPLAGLTTEGRGLCDDGHFLVTQNGRLRAQQAAALCPTGHRLADVSDALAFRRAIEVLFTCRGPLSEAWVGRVRMNGAKVRLAVKVTAPEAIEKGSAAGVVQARVDLPHEDAELPSICERILAQTGSAQL